jgi:HEAT repeat protein
MGFRDFISSFRGRRKIIAEFERFQKIRPPANPSRRYIDELMLKLLDSSSARNAHKELCMIGTAVVPSALAALNDPRFQQYDWPKFCHAPAPMNAVLELLVNNDRHEVIDFARKHISHQSSAVRKTLARWLAQLADTSAVPMLTELFKDEDGYVRSYVCIGINWAISEQRATREFLDAMYLPLLEQCDQDWAGTTSDAARTLVAIDAVRAARDLASDRFLSAANQQVHYVLKACNEKRILLPVEKVQAVLNASLPLTTQENCYPHQYNVANALTSLALSTGRSIEPLIKSMMDSRHEVIQETAAAALGLLAGADDPIGFVIKANSHKGFENLTNAQQVVYCAFMFDAEVCNGGLLQFFGNTSGDHVAETLEALRILGHLDAEYALRRAIQLAGPLSRETDREIRLTAFENRFDELQAAYRPLEDAYYSSKGTLRQKIFEFAAKNAADFR